MVDVLSQSDLNLPEALVRRLLDGEEAASARIVRLHRAAMVRVEPHRT